MVRRWTFVKVEAMTPEEYMIKNPTAAGVATALRQSYPVPVEEKMEDYRLLQKLDTPKSAAR
jgi:hypothetical protein